MPDPTEFVVEDAQIIFRNFSGREGPFNREGDRNFAVILDDESARTLEADGWHVKYLKPRDVDDEVQEPRPYIPIAVSYKNRPPKIVLITSGSRTHVDEKMVEVLDSVEIKTADLIARAYRWEAAGKTGIKAYLKSLFITVDEDYLERKYSEYQED